MSSILRASRTFIGSASRRVPARCISAVVARSAPSALFRASAAPFVNISRSFGAAAPSSGSSAETFMDPKVVTDRIIEVVKNFEKVTASKVSAESRFKEDLNLDSLDAVEIVMAIEEEFAIEIPDSEADKILSIADAVNYISNHPMAK